MSRISIRTGVTRTIIAITIPTIVHTSITWRTVIVIKKSINARTGSINITHIKSIRINGITCNTTCVRKCCTINATEMAFRADLFVFLKEMADAIAPTSLCIFFSLISCGITFCTINGMWTRTILARKMAGLTTYRISIVIVFLFAYTFKNGFHCPNFWCAWTHAWWFPYRSERACFTLGLERSNTFPTGTMTFLAFLVRTVIIISFYARTGTIKSQTIFSEIFTGRWTYWALCSTIASHTMLATVVTWSTDLLIKEIVKPIWTHALRKPSVYSNLISLRYVKDRTFIAIILRRTIWAFATRVVAFLTNNIRFVVEVSVFTGTCFVYLYII